MMELDAQDFDELVKLLSQAEQSVAALSNGNSEEEMEKSRLALLSFHATAAMLGLDSFDKAGAELETFLANNVLPASVDSIASLEFAINLVVDGLKGLKEGKGDQAIDLEVIREILGPPQSPADATGQSETGDQTAAQEAAGSGEAAPEAAQDDGGEESFEYLREKIKSLGGELASDSDEHVGTTFKITFTASTETLRKVEKLVRAGENSTSGSYRTIEESIFETVKANVNDFIEAFSSADMEGAQNILLKLAEQPSSNSGLYKEIGVLARGLHDSILSFLHTLDPSLLEIVESKIPDSGNRLEHILEMTEKSALTTLDHVEAMQERLASETDHICRLREVLGGLKAIGDSAGKKLEQSGQTLEALEALIEGHRADLDIILSVQDYQDLSGQIIQKITKLLKDIEGKLVNLIKTFGVKAETSGEKDSDELYGPAHAAVEDAVHSQDEVDSLLSEFGF